MRSKIVLVCCLLFAAVLGGCIEFKSQTLVFTHDGSADTLKLFQDYHAIFGGDKQSALSPEELEQLDSVLNGQRTFFFGNWIGEISHNQLRDRLTEFKDPQYKKENELSEASLQHLETLVKLLLENVRIENGPFYNDNSGKLSAVQYVRISNVSKLISAGNEVIRDALSSEALKPQTSEEIKALYLSSTREQPEYIKLEGNRLSVRLPATREQYAQQTAHAAEEMEDFKKSGGSIIFTNNHVSVSIGEPSQKFTTLTMKFSDKAYVTNLLESIKARMLLKDTFDPKAASEKFFSAGK